MKCNKCYFLFLLAVFLLVVFLLVVFLFVAFLLAGFLLAAFLFFVAILFLSSWHFIANFFYLFISRTSTKLSSFFIFLKNYFSTLYFNIN